MAVSIAKGGASCTHGACVSALSSCAWCALGIVASPGLVVRLPYANHETHFHFIFLNFNAIILI